MLNFRRVAACVTVAVTLLAGSPAMCADELAPDPQRLEMAKHLFSVLHMDRTIDQTMRTMVPAMLEQLRKTNPSLTAERSQIVADSVTEAVGPIMTKMIARSIPFYATTFSARELRDMIDFYEGPSGQAMLNKMPLITAKITPMMAEILPEMTAEVDRRVCAKIDCSTRTAPPAPTS